MIVMVIQIERQIILSIGKNKLATWFRVIIGIVMAVIGSVILHQIMFKKDVEKQKIENYDAELCRNFIYCRNSANQKSMAACWNAGGSITLSVIARDFHLTVKTVMIKKIVVSVVCFIGFSCQAQQLTTPKQIRFKEGFQHKASNTSFPQILGDGYELTEVVAFDKKTNNVGATYEKNSEPKGRLTVYIYPAGDGTENRLRSEYLYSTQAVANLKSARLTAEQRPVKFSGENFDCNGFKAVFKPASEKISSVAVYECGAWFFKYRLTLEEKDSLATAKLENMVLSTFDPSLLTEQKPLKEKPDVYFTEEAFQDSILLGSAMGSAFKKAEWVMDHIPARERASGFPGHYLEMQLAALKEFVAFDKRHSYQKSEYTQQYLSQLNSLIEVGFLDEFVMEEFSMLMIVPENHLFDFEEYTKWRTENEITIDLHKLFYVIAFGQN